MKIAYRLWKHLDKKNYASPLTRRIHRYLSEKLMKSGKINYFYPLLPLPKRSYNANETATLASYKKFFSLQLYENVLETLIVGSSHGYYGYRADGGFHEINACEVSQDLYYSYEIYKKYADAPRLKNIVFFYSVFSSGFVLELSIPKLCDPYYYFYGIPYRFGECPDNQKKKEAFSSFAARVKQHPDFKYVGNITPPYFFTKSTAEQRTEDHLKCNRRDENQTAYVAKAAELAKEKGHKLYVVIPPCRSDYVRCTPPYEQLFSELSELKDRINILSFYGDERFTDSDFGDTDHLNDAGAQKLTGFIREMMM